MYLLVQAFALRGHGSAIVSSARSLVWLAVLSLTCMMLLLAGCNGESEPTATPAATPLPDIPLRADGGSVRASGNIEPAHKAQLAYTTVGRIQEIAVQVGDSVVTGERLIALDANDAEAVVAQAQSALFQARANLEALTDGARIEEIEMAEAKLAAAQARLAQRAEQARPEAVAAAEANVRAAEAAYRQLFNDPTESERVDALVELSNAKAAVQQAQSAYNQVAWRSDVGATVESRELQQATNNLEAAQARYDALFANPTADNIAAANAQIMQAEAELDRLKAPGSKNELAEAEALLRSAQAELDLLTAGARDSEIAAAAMAIAQAEASLRRAEAALEAMSLRAPFDGVVTAVDVNLGETVQIALPVLTMASLDHLRLETTDLSERDVARVAVGQPALVFVKPLNDDFTGHVVQVSPQASTIGGDIVYTVIVEFDQQPPDLRWGMSADVTIGEE